MNDDMFDIENKNTEYEIDGKIGEIIGITKGTLQTFKNNLQMLEYCHDNEKTFYELKDEVTSFINGMEECCILPTRELLCQNPVTAYRFCMYELCDRFQVKNYRETMEELYKIYDEIVPEDQLQSLLHFANRISRDAEIMLAIADERVAEIVRNPSLIFEKCCILDFMDLSTFSKMNDTKEMKNESYYGNN